MKPGNRFWEFAVGLVVIVPSVDWLCGAASGQANQGP